MREPICGIDIECDICGPAARREYNRIVAINGNTITREIGMYVDAVETRGCGGGERRPSEGPRPALTPEQPWSPRYLSATLRAVNRQPRQPKESR